MPRRASGATCTASCSTPPSSTPQTSAKIGRCQHRDERDGAPDHRQVEQHRSQPPARGSGAARSETRSAAPPELISSRYGKSQRVSSTVSIIASGCAPKPGARSSTQYGASSDAEHGHAGDHRRQAGGQGAQGALGLGSGTPSDVFREDRDEGRRSSLPHRRIGAADWAGGRQRRRRPRRCRRRSSSRSPRRAADR